MEQRPIRVVVRDDDLTRPRLTVIFRLLLAIPHLVWLTLWGIAAWTVGFAAWLAVLIEAQVPAILHDFLAAYVRYALHVNAYVFLAAQEYPGFRGRPGYAVDVEIDPPARQSRWSGGFRLLLALPALILAAFVASGLGVGGSLPVPSWSLGAAGAAAFLGWFACLALGRMPRGLRDLVAYGIGYGAQVGAYALLVTGRYPDSNPELVEPRPQLPPHAVRIAVGDELRRSRLTTFFRLALALPHFVWLAGGPSSPSSHRLSGGWRHSCLAACPSRCTASSPPTCATPRTSSPSSPLSATRSRASPAARARTRSTSRSRRLRRSLAS